PSDLGVGVDVEEPPAPRRPEGKLREPPLEILPDQLVLDTLEVGILNPVFRVGVCLAHGRHPCSSWCSRSSLLAVLLVRPASPPCFLRSLAPCLSLLVRSARGPRL